MWRGLVLTQLKEHADIPKSLLLDMDGHIWLTQMVYKEMVTIKTLGKCGFSMLSLEPAGILPTD
jgi:hypothetical protein